MEEMILAGRITVNRMPAEVGQKVGPGDEVRINGELVRVRFTEPRARVLMYHKPAGELVTRDDPEGRPTVFERLPSIGNGKWINVGRLDYNTEGLLLFTNSGELANRLMHPRYEVEREYAVRIMGRLTDEQAQALVSGVQLDDGPARCEKVTDGGGDDDGANHWYTVVLKEGRNREVRRLFEALGLMVSRLIRTRYGMLAMPASLGRGELTELEPGDVNALVASAGLRSSDGGEQRPEGRHPRTDREGGRPDHAQGARPAKHKGHPRRPHGAGKPGPAQGGQPSGGPGRGAPPHAARGQGFPPATPYAQPPGGRPGKRGAARPGHPKHEHPAAPDGGQRPGTPAERARPPRAHHNFDEVQPQSNANAMPFGRTTLKVPGGAPRGFGNDAGARHRSGPRARHAKFGPPNGNGGGGAHGAGGNVHRGAPSGAFGGPGRGKRPPHRPRGDGNGSVAPKGEVNGNVAPPGERPFSSDDDA